jgi:hypothetical protein
MIKGLGKPFPQGKHALPGYFFIHSRALIGESPLPSMYFKLNFIFAILENSNTLEFEIITSYDRSKCYFLIHYLNNVAGHEKYFASQASDWCSLMSTL